MLKRPCIGSLHPRGSGGRPVASRHSRWHRRSGRERCRCVCWRSRRPQSKSTSVALRSWTSVLKQSRPAWLLDGSKPSQWQQLWLQQVKLPRSHGATSAAPSASGVVPLSAYTSPTVISQKTFKDNFRCTKETFSLLATLLSSSAFATAEESQHISRAAAPRKDRRATARCVCAHRMRQVLDAPNLRFKLAAWLYAMGQGGRMKPLADACSIGLMPAS